MTWIVDHLAAIGIALFVIILGYFAWRGPRA